MSLVPLPLTVMKFLTIVRHAKAEPILGFESDFVRPLAPKGVEDAYRLSQVWSPFSSHGNIITSPATRTKQTAKFFEQKTGWKCTEVPALYNASLSALTESVQFNFFQAEGLVICHNPGGSELNYFLSGEFIEFHTCGISKLKLHIDRWEDLHKGCATLIEYFSPKTM